MKFAFAIFRYFPFGGLQRSAISMAKEALARGHSVTFFCGSWEGERPAGIEVRELKQAVLFNTAGIRSFTEAFRHTFQRNEFDLLLGFNKMPGLDVYYCGDSCFAKKAFDERSWWYRLAPRSQCYLANEHAVFSCDVNTRILDVSVAERPEFARFYGTAAERFHLLPPGINRSHVLSQHKKNTNIRTEFSIPIQAKIIACIGSGFKTKGLDRSINTLAELVHTQQVDVYLLVVGADKSANFYTQAKRLGIVERVIFTGGRADLAALYQAADLLLHPAYREVTGNVLLEAMLAGVPVVASNVCGYAPYVLDYGLGEIISAPYAIADIAQAVQRVLTTEKSHWIAQSQVFSKQADIFSRPERAVDLLESFVRSPATIDQWQQCDKQQQRILRKPLIDPLHDKPIFEYLKNISGTVARAMPGRTTLRIVLDGQHYYRKWHSGVGWREIIKNLLALRLPVIGASNEWYALNKLAALNIPSLTPLAYGKRGYNPARQESFIVTAELANMIKLEALFKQNALSFTHKRLVIAEVARMARAMHTAGINHRDFYLCHFLLDPSSLTANTKQAPRIVLVDLHRAQLRAKVPRRWQIKDLGGLYFSALDMNFSRRDVWYFLRVYFAQNLTDLMATQGELLRAIEARAIATYRRDFGRMPQLPLSSSQAMEQPV